MVEDNCFQQESREFIEALIEQGLDDELINQFVELAEDTPLHMRDEAGAIHMLEEMITLLCALFLLYYHNFIRSTVDKLVYTIKVFKGMGFGERVLAADYFRTPGVANLVSTLKNMCIMVSLVAMQLEDFVVSSNLENHPFVEDKEKITSELFKESAGPAWGTVDAHAPVLLAWSLWEYMAEQKTNDFGQAHEHLRQALDSKAIQYLITVFTNGMDEDIAIIGYKSVVRDLVYAMLALFNADSAIWQQAPVFRLYCLTNDGAVPLATQFWEEDRESICGELVQQATLNFPMSSAPLLQVMKALSSDSDTACNAYVYIENLSYFAMPIEEGSSTIMTEDEADQTQVVAANQINNDGWVIPQYTRGSRSSEKAVVWQHNFNGWHWVLAFLNNFASNSYQRLKLGEEPYETAAAAFELIANIMQFQDELTHRFYQDCNGVLPQLLPRFLLDSLVYQHPIPISVAALKCIQHIAETCSASMMWRRLTPALFQKVRLTVREMDLSSHSITLGVLRLIDCVLHSSVQDERAVPQYEETAVPLQLSEMEEALHFCHDVFTNFSGWVYSDILEKWQIGEMVMRIYYKVLTDYSPTGSKSADNPNNIRVHTQVLMRILLNKETQRTLFSVISLGADILERHQKQQALEDFVLCALALVDTALAMRPKDQATTLLDAVFENNRLHFIADFARYKRNTEICVRALRILTQASRADVPFSSVIQNAEKLRGSWLAFLTTTQTSVRFHVLALLSSILQNQPSMIIALCSVKGSEVALAADGTSVARREAENKPTLDKVILQILQGKPIEHNPQVCSETCRLIHLLWKHATNLDTVQELRANKQFWEMLVEIVMSHHTADHFNISARAWALLTISLEITASPKHIAQNAFSTIASEQTQKEWIATHVPTDLPQQMKECIPNGGFDSVPVINSSFDLDKIFGDRYLYDTSRLDRKAAPTLLIERVQAANNCLSDANAYSFFLRAWSAYLYSAMQTHAEWFSDIPGMVSRISEKLFEAQAQAADYPALSLLEGVAPLFLMLCKFLPAKAKIDDKALAKIIDNLANVFRKHKYNNTDALAHLCTGLVVLLSKLDILGESWRNAELIVSSENLVDASWALAENYERLHDSVFCLLGFLLKATGSPTLILNNTRQPSLLVLMNILANLFYKEESASHVENILNFVVKLAAHPESASALLSDGLLNVLCNRSAPFFSKFSHPAYTAKTDTRNTWHRAWCACVMVITQLLRTLKHTEEAPRRAMEFVNAHSDKLWAALNVQNVALKYGVLEELDKAVKLVKELAIFTHNWRYAPPEFANKWGMCIVRLVHYLVYIFSLEKGVKHTLLLSRDVTENSAGDDVKISMFLNCIQNCFFILQLSGPQIGKLISAHGNPAQVASLVDFVIPIFAPSNNFDDTSTPNLSIPEYAVHHAFNALRAYITSTGPNKFPPSQRPTLLAIIELSLTLLFSHTLYFLHKLDVSTHPEQVQLVHGMGESTVRSMSNYLADIQNTCNEADLLLIKQYHAIFALILQVPI